MPIVGLAMAAALSGCSRDAGRDVKPMAPPLSSASTSSGAAPTEILPPDAVRKSQGAAVAQRIANTEITVTYSRPVARGRTLFGGIVPYGVVWNPGADQATAIAFSRDVQIDGQPLAAGKYSLWVIPRPDRWTVIFSRAGEVYHTPYPGEAEDALRLEAEPEIGPHVEVLTFSFPEVEGKDAVIRLEWGTVRIPLRVRVP